MYSYEELNPMQQEAVMATQGPLLILAGAGSGKTRVLTHRIAHLIEEERVAPWNILAITFTNKAAKEMRERVDRIMGNDLGSSVWVSTFHSLCVRILRRNIDRIGYENHFTIYDTDDQLSVMKEVCRNLDIDTKLLKEKAILSVISSAKDRLMTANDLENEAPGDYENRKLAAAYREYEKIMRKNNALDFDDLIMKTVELFRQCDDVLYNYQQRFQYIMVDEYQDTNHAQFELVRLLASEYRNLCVVGDDDQSIYRFRGADIQNILSFERNYQDTHVVRLEQNYRSKQNILNAANAVISNNYERKEKTLWTENEVGEPIHIYKAEDAYEEAEYVLEQIQKKVRLGAASYSDFAVLYRTHAQSRIFEEKCVRASIPYRLVGGVNFYGRKEIKDVLAYLKTINNGQDDLAVNRIINVPKRGIGAATIKKISDYADDMGYSFFNALRMVSEIPSIGKAASKVNGFVDQIFAMRAKAEVLSITELIKEVLEVTGYEESLRKENTEESNARVENIDELISKAADYEEREIQAGRKPMLSDFLEEVSLVADMDSLDPEQEYILLMTLHGAKGLEFPHVYMVGMEEQTFPGARSIYSDDPEDMEEERRLCYVGITRAMETLTLTSASKRMVRGEMHFFRNSRFVSEIPRELTDLGTVRKQTTNPFLMQQKRSGLLGEIMPGRAETERKVLERKVEKKPAFKLDDYKTVKADALEYTVGDQVRHVKFGTGRVQKIVDGGRDYEVTVEFEKYGVKKMFAGFAKLKKL